ncbi:MAG: exo-alpha-sialidase [Planctomycetes bacterium]|nr:exo-alpha-sialidase [Planctomycetota bacterium]
MREAIGKALLAAWWIAAFGSAPAPAAMDPRHIRAGSAIPDEGYCDQPYVVIAKDGRWLCVLTTGEGKEGQKGQHVVSTTSADRGKTWSPLVDIEPADGPEASWVVPLIVPSGRVYAFYTYNGDRIATLREKPIRTDMLGWYVYKYSDDGGRSWSKERYRLPMRLTACDRGNDWKGEVQIFWGISKPIVADRTVFFAFTKLGRYMLDDGEGWLYRSENLLEESDVTRIRWEVLPEGDHGIRDPAFGSVQEEHNIVALRDGSLYCVYRTTNGFPCHAYSRDGGRTWTKPEPMTYAPGGRRMKTPRACPKVWRTADGRFLFWYHNHGGKTFEGRNPAWIAGGIERDGHIHWSQPEVLLYDDDPKVRMSYPDLIEDGGRFWVTETQKSIARVHAIDRGLLDGLWSQGEAAAVARDGLVLDLGEAEIRAGRADLPASLDLRATGGLSVELRLSLESLAAGQTIVDSRDAQGRGFALTTAEGGAIRVDASDGTAKANWACDPGILEAGKGHHIVAIIDAGPKIITFVVDGILCDGGDARPCGWGRFAEALGDVRGTGTLRIAPSLRGQVRGVRIYDRCLRTSEAVASFRAGPKA